MVGKFYVSISCVAVLWLTACGGGSSGSPGSSSDGVQSSSPSASSSASSTSSSESVSSSSESETPSSSSSSSSFSATSSESSSSSTSMGVNLSLGAGSDGSSKASGTSYGNVRDGDTSTYWAPDGASGRISIKWDSAVTLSAVIIREATGFEGNIGDWQLVNNDTDNVITSGSGAGTISFDAVVLEKINLEILTATGIATVAEFETYGSQASGGSSSSDATSASSSEQSSASSDASETSSSSSSASLSSSSSSSLPPVTGELSDACIALVTDNTVNWDESSLQTDQEIVECLSGSLGRAVGYGENALGGYDPGGSSNLVVISSAGATSVEQQLLTAISSSDHNWIVFDKDDFATATDVAMYRLDCSDSAMISKLGSEAQCLDHTLWCSNNSIGAASCMDSFFNDQLDDSSLPTRNRMIASNTTIDGRGSNAYFLFNGFKIGADSSGSATATSENVILTHLLFQGAGHTEDHGMDPDMIRSTGESHDIWIHKNTFDTTGDSAFDVKVGAYDITMSFNKVKNVKRAALHGSSDSRTINAQIRTTMHHNNFVTTDDQYDALGDTGRRVPLIRRGRSHQFNNLFMNYRKDILSIRVGASVLHEDNLFLINALHQEKSDLDTALDERAEQLMRDYDDGNFLSSGTYLYFSDSECNLDSSTQRDLSATQGAVVALASDYNSASQAAITVYGLSAGQNLATYVGATAGVGGFIPFNSPMASSISAVIAAHSGGCQ